MWEGSGGENPAAPIPISSNLEVGSNTNLARSLHKPAVFGAYLEHEVASWSAVFWSEPDRLRHQGTLGVAMAWKWEMRTEVTPEQPWTLRGTISPTVGGDK